MIAMLWAIEPAKSARLGNLWRFEVASISQAPLHGCELLPDDCGQMQPSSCALLV